MALAASGLWVPRARAASLGLLDPGYLGMILAPSLLNLRLWLKADGLVLNNNDPVATLTDFSGLGRNFTAAGTARPTFLVGQKQGLPGVQFDGANNVMTGTLDTGVTAYSLFIVLKLLSTLSTPVVFQHGDGTNSYLLMSISINRTIQHRTGATPTSMQDGSANTTSYELWSAISTAAPASTFRVNAVNQTLTPSSGAFGAPPNTGFLGGFSSGILRASFVFCEMLLHNVALSVAERNKTEAYLRAKWGL